MLDKMSTVDRIRRNHALEHATMHLLSSMAPNLRLVGRSDWAGFWLYGDVDTNLVATLAREALRRLDAGEASLAVHPRCGTNLTVAMFLGGIGGAIVSRLLRRWCLLRFTSVMAVSFASLSMGRTVGLIAQRHLTTDPIVAGVRIAGVERGRMGDVVTHHVIMLHPTPATNRPGLSGQQSQAS